LLIFHIVLFSDIAKQAEQMAEYLFLVELHIIITFMKFPGYEIMSTSLYSAHYLHKLSK